MKTLKSADFNVFTDASLVNQTIHEAFKRVNCDGCTSKVRMDLTLEVLRIVCENNSNVLVSRTLSGFDLSGNHAVRAYQDLTREIPGLIAQIQAGKFLIRISLETGAGRSSYLQSAGCCCFPSKGCSCLNLFTPDLGGTAGSRDADSNYSF